MVAAGCSQSCSVTLSGTAVSMCGMPKRSGSAHVATIKTRGKGGKEYTSYLLRRSYREGGKVRHENLGNLSHLPPHVIEAIRKMLARSWLTTTIVLPARWNSALLPKTG